MGGYSSFPICFGSINFKNKFIIYENNLIIGKANKYLLPFADKILFLTRNLRNSKKYKNKVLEIGNLIREEIINFKKLQKINFMKPMN